MVLEELGMMFDHCAVLIGGEPTREDGEKCVKGGSRGEDGRASGKQEGVRMGFCEGEGVD